MKLINTKYLFVFVFLMGCGSNRSISSDTKSAYEPHRPRKGPWFEGWYARTSDKKGERSVAVIVGSHVTRDNPSVSSLSLPGYVGVLLSEGGGLPTRSWTFFPKDTLLKVSGQEVTTDPALWKHQDAPFLWEAPGVGSFQNRQIHIAVPGQVEVDIDLTDDGKSWNESGPPLGPEGYLAPLPVPLHWYVKSLNGSTRYRVKTWTRDGDMEEVQGEGTTHLEKNWGASFPIAWNWLQATDPQDDAQLVVGGGTLGMLGVSVKAWLMGYRSEKESWDIRFSDPGTFLSIEEKSCAGTFSAQIKRGALEVDIKAHAPLTSFGPVAVPTEQGFVADQGIESFSARIEVHTYRIGLWGRKLTDHRVFRNGALEFGAGSYVKSCGDGLKSGGF